MLRLARLTRISPVLAALALALSGCDAPAPDAGSPPAPQVTSAFFSEPPDRIFAAAREACNRPGARFVQPAKGVVQCQMLIHPESTAAAILSYDGMLDDLPRLSMSLAAARAGEGWVVTGCAFLRIPQKDGRLARVVQNDRRIDARLAQLLAAAGGQPVAEVTPAQAERCFAS